MMVIAQRRESGHDVQVIERRRHNPVVAAGMTAFRFMFAPWVEGWTGLSALRIAGFTIIGMTYELAHHATYTYYPDGKVQKLEAGSFGIYHLLGFGLGGLLLLGAKYADKWPEILRALRGLPATPLDPAAAVPVTVPVTPPIAQAG